MGDHTRCWCGSEDFETVYQKGRRCEHCGAWVERFDLVSLKDCPTCILVDELCSRIGNGVDVVEVAPYESKTLSVEGACVVLIIND